MTTCLAVGENAVAVSSIDADRCFVCSLDSGRVKNLTECLGETYGGMPVDSADLRKACAAFSSDGTLFAYNTNRGKLLSLWNAGDWSLIANRTLAKNATSVVFTPRTNAVVVADKKGDVYALGGERPVRVLGHSSMILDLCFSENEKYVVTCDSDEKVRVSHYPNGKNILHYMMGHEAYVSGVCTLDGFVLSGSGDRTLRLWDLGDGNLVHKLALRSAVRSVVKIEDAVAVQPYDSNKVHVVKTETNDDGKRVVKIVKTVEFENNVLNMAARGNRLWIVAGNSVYNYEVDPSGEIVARNDSDGVPKTYLETLNKLVEPFVRLENTNLLVFLYKKMIDKQKRTEGCVNNSSPAVPGAKRIKQN